jgi:23S rRNA (adenine2503-C2)-methyltransferase
MFPSSLEQEIKSSCGTLKFLQRLDDNNFIESVLIPSFKYDRTTLCVSTQIGCERRCAFCLTGKMGLIRNLSGDEIVSQVYYGKRLVRQEKMPSLTNIVFMGMTDCIFNTTVVMIY